eukprot:TRINITY_DN16725_c0_g1_i2.p1 TRINITY_DN16725_c0_g1~~TRINITY_DN16725_c0_g1_i2.p1  ORF type:complete len:660 (+),score=111.32 TRINITY_DN16725_c0_g1_i2:172-2151(+)
MSPTPPETKDSKQMSHAMPLPPPQLTNLPPLRAFCSLARSFWWDSPATVRLDAFARLFAIIGLQLVRSKVSVRLSAERRLQVDTMMKHGGSDRSLILRGLLRYLLSLVMLSPVNKIYYLMLRALRQKWTEQLTERFLADFVESQCLTYGEDKEKMDKVPDQRIANDIGTFTMLATMLGLDSLQACINLYFSSAALRGISPQLSWSVVACALLGTAGTQLLGRRLPRLYSMELFTNNDFAYSLARLRENAESVAFYGGQRREYQQVCQKFSMFQQAIWDRFFLKDVVQLFSSAYRQVSGLLPIYLLAGRMLPSDGTAVGTAASASSRTSGLPMGHPHAPRDAVHAHAHGHSHSKAGPSSGGGTNMGLLGQARELFDDCLSQLLVLAENTSDFSRLRTLSIELNACLQRSERACRQRQSLLSAGKLQLRDLHACGREARRAQSWLQLEDVTLFSGGGSRRPLVSNLSVKAPETGGLVIHGASGVGKTTLLRAIAGLWTAGEGVITREMGLNRVLFLPQQPYLQQGSLRDQLSYPHQEPSALDDASLKSVLHRVGLGHVVNRVSGDLDVCLRWTEVLSVGEQQRIGVARILVHRPRYCILDEITSANDAKHEAIMYECVREICEAWVSVSHRPSVDAFHHHRLTLLGEAEEGRWVLEPLSHC